MPMKIVQKSKKVLCICNSLIAVYSSKKVINFMIIVPRNSRISEWDYWLGSLCWPPPTAILDCWRGTTKKCAIPKFYLIDIKPVRPWKCNKLIRLRWKSWKNFCFKDCARHGNLIMGFIKLYSLWISFCWQKQMAAEFFKELKLRLNLSKRLRLQGRHSKFEPDKAQYSTQDFFDRLSLIRTYWKPKSRQGPGLGGLASRGARGLISHVI